LLEKQVEKAANGDLEALKFLADRYEGRVPQLFGGDQESGPVSLLVRSGVPRHGDNE
jgi:hypothetical protein